MIDANIEAILIKTAALGKDKYPNNSNTLNKWIL